MGSAIGSSPRPDLAAALHRLRSTLARLKAELELAEVDGATPPPEVLMADLKEALETLTAVEDAAFGVAPVLVMDDDHRLAELTARGLRRLGYEVESGVRLRALRAREIVVFDLGLVAGLAAGERAALRSARPIVVTGATDPASRAMAASLNAAEYLVKPVDLEVLAAAIGRRIAEGLA
ncbi:MAG: response regulator [Candidatus Dormibacteraceae bacterium]